MTLGYSGWASNKTADKYFFGRPSKKRVKSSDVASHVSGDEDPTPHTGDDAVKQKVEQQIVLTMSLKERNKKPMGTGGCGC